MFQKLGLQAVQDPVSDCPRRTLACNNIGQIGEASFENA